MHIESLAIKNFRCFGNAPVYIPFNNGVTGFVGDNGAGKSAVLDAIKRLFSPVASERIFRRTDVHFGPWEDSQNVEERELTIDVVFAFDDPDKLPHVFNDMFFDAGTGALKVRVVCECHYKKAVFPVRAYGAKEGNCIREDFDFI
ncbi:ATP-dependent endonuclease [Kordiimonas lipolytica]|uniref:ATP-dependent endonuclease n=1 Tax=Kordiimonas lipolytica TaxID=1662421 RepID=A0ABV8UBC3_9PROT|nr:AAA family ATPase [Kordiimonas lipolytica]